MSPTRVTTTAQPGDAPRLAPWRWPVVVAGLGLLVLALAWPRPSASVAEPLPAATSTPCQSGAVWLELVQRQQVAGDYDVAVANAMTALGVPNLCPDDRATLAGVAVMAGLEALWAQPFPAADARAQQAALARLAELRRLADQYGVSLPSHRQLAGRAYDTGQWLVARTEWEAALAAGEIGCDQRQVQFYVSAVYNRGRWLVESGQAAAVQEGRALLAAAHALDVRYRVGSGAAAGVLRQLAGPNEAAWPRPAPLPLLTAPPAACAP